MNRRSVVGAVGMMVSAGAILSAGVLLGIAPEPGASAPAAPAPGAPAKVVPAEETRTGYPEIKAKQLWAEKDVRGKNAPEFAVEQWLTKDQKAPERAGKVVLIDFWATWCGPCRRLIPELNTWQKTFKDDLVIIGVSDEKPDTVKSFMGSTSVDYAMAIDTKKTMKDALGIKGIPHVLVISSDGVVRWQGFPQSSEDRLTEATLRQIIETDKASRGKKSGEAKDANAAPAKKP